MKQKSSIKTNETNTTTETDNTPEKDEGMNMEQKNKKKTNKSTFI